MERKEIYQAVAELFAACELNYVKEDVAIHPSLSGLKMFEEPLVKFGSATDELFQKYKEEGVIGPWFDTPDVWLAEGKTVISLFFPFTEAVRKSNRKCTEIPSSEWLHGRIEGQACLTGFMNRLKDWFEKNGVSACVPSNDPRFHRVLENGVYGSNWSERHVAYLCGLGTFGLSKGIITEKGMAGRFMSIIVSEEIAPDERPYTGIYDYCTKCGACIKRCPAQAISLENGKEHAPCDEWNLKIGAMHAPRFGCGLCQVKVPCESKKPVTSEELH